MKEFEIEIKETLSRIIKINAISENEAFLKVKKMYHDEEIVLDDSEFVDTEFIKNEDS
jgi:DpnD/PcfM-like protein